MLIKHNSRSLRAGCKRCGSKELYKAHDTDLPGKYDDENDCVQCGNISGRIVFVEKDDHTRGASVGEQIPQAVRHADVCPGKPADDYAQDDVTCPSCDLKMTREHFTDHHKCAPAPSVPDYSTPALSPSPDMLGALQTLMSMMGPQVDESMIRRVVDEKLDGIVAPTTTVYQPVDGDPVQVDGAHEALPKLLRMIARGRHVMMVGPAGTGKSHLAESVAQALTLPFRFVACHPLMTPTPLIGFIDAGGTYHRTGFRECYENGGVFLFDEIDNSNSSVLASMNAALANGHMEFPDGLVKRHEDFRCVAAGNTFGRGADKRYVGRQKLDAATIDRFAMVYVDYDETLERSLCLATGASKSVVDNTLRLLRRMRRNALTKDMAVIVSQRATVGVCEMVMDGFTTDEAIEAMVYKGMTSDERAKLNG